MTLSDLKWLGEIYDDKVSRCLCDCWASCHCRLKTATHAFSLYRNHFGGPKNQYFGSSSGKPQVIRTKFCAHAQVAAWQRLVNFVQNVGSEFFVWYTRWHFANFPTSDFPKIWPHPAPPPFSKRTFPSLTARLYLLESRDRERWLCQCQASKHNLGFLWPYTLTSWPLRSSIHALSLGRGRFMLICIEIGSFVFEI